MCSKGQRDYDESRRRDVCQRMVAQGNHERRVEYQHREQDRQQSAFINNQGRDECDGKGRVRAVIETERWPPPQTAVPPLDGIHTAECDYGCRDKSPRHCPISSSASPGYQQGQQNQRRIDRIGNRAKYVDRVPRHRRSV